MATAGSAAETIRVVRVQILVKRLDQPSNLALRLPRLATLILI